MNRCVKNIIFSGARTCGIFRLARLANGKALRILSYHGVDDHISPALNRDGFFVPSGVFRRHLEALKSYRVIALDEAAARGEWPGNAVAITFDDGYANNLSTAAPILRSFGYPATFFLTTGFLSGSAYPWWFCVRQAAAEGHLPDHDFAGWEARLKNQPASDRAASLAALGISPRWREGLPSMLAWDTARQLASLGFSLGAHTAGHVSLAHETEAAAAAEVADSLAALRDHDITPSVWYSYPYGAPENLRNLDELFRKTGIQGAVTEKQGLNRPGDDPFRMARISLTANHTPLDLQSALSGWRPGH